MDNRIGNIKEKSLANVKQQMLGLLSDTVIQKAQLIVKRYNTETEAILFSEGLKQIKNMLQMMINDGIDYRDPSFGLIVDEWQKRVLAIDKTIKKARCNGLNKSPSGEDEKNKQDIIKLLGRIVGREQAMPFQTIIPLLQEAEHDRVSSK